MGFPGGSVIKNLPKNPPAMQEMWARFLAREGPLEKEMATASIVLPEKSHGQTRLMGYSPWGHKRVRLDLATQKQSTTLWEIIILNLSTNSSTQPLINF